MFGTIGRDRPEADHRTANAVLLGRSDDTVLKTVAPN
jgi:hypothetical protein